VEVRVDGQALLVPVGYSLGAFHPVEDAAEHLQQIRVGAASYEAWQWGHGDHLRR
jgi:hypothetical protein